MSIHVIAIGASAGGVKALTTLARTIPEDLPAALVVVMHLSAHFPSMLAEILDGVGPFKAVPAEHGQTVKVGHIYVAVPDRHVLLQGSKLRLTRGPKENRHRPSIDVLFRSCAESLGSQAIGVVLTGMLDDGTAGLWAIKDRGGLAIVQDPREAECSSMPESALRHVAIDHTAALAEMPALFLQALREVSERPSPKASDKLSTEVRIALGVNALSTGSIGLGTPSSFTCPSCAGAMVEIFEGTNVRFRCHTGHAYSAQSLQSGYEDEIDKKLWQALRAIEERVLLFEKRAERLAASDSDLAEAFRSEAKDTRKRGERIRELLLDETALGHSPDQALKDK